MAKLSAREVSAREVSAQEVSVQPHLACLEQPDCLLLPCARCLGQLPQPLWTVVEMMCVA